MLTGHRTPILMTYDANDCLVKEHHTLPGGNRDVIRAYDKDSRETSVTCGSAKVEKAFDELGRLSSIKRNGGKHVTEFTYAAAPDGGATGRVKGADYYYIRDGLMCITGLVDANGGAVVNYRYDSWGKLISITGSMAGTLGKDNPYRYKGYYYDDETRMYYLKSRYYQPEICRFISADDEDVLIDTHANLSNKNLYLYCDNNPVLKADEEGQIAVWLVSAALGAAVNVAASFIIARTMEQEFGVKDVAVAAVTGALSGGLGAAFKYGKYASAVLNGVFTGAVAYRSGASLKAALISGGVTALFSASGIGDLANLDLVKEGHVVVGNVVATGSIDLVVNTGYTGMSSAVSAAVTSAYKKKGAASSRSKKNSYFNSMRPRKLSDKKVRIGGQLYRQRQYLYHGRRYTRWDKL